MSRRDGKTVRSVAVTLAAGDAGSPITVGDRTPTQNDGCVRTNVPLEKKEASIELRTIANSDIPNSTLK